MIPIPRLCSYVFALFQILAVAGTAPALAEEKEPITMGVLLPLTGFGAPVAEAGRIGIELAVKELNEAGGIDGRQINIVIADDQSDTSIAVNEVKRLVHQAGIDVLIGSAVSQNNLAILPVLNEAKIPSISLSGAQTLTTEAGPYHFSLFVNAEFQSVAMVDYAKNALNAQSAAVIADAGAQGKFAAEALKRDMEAAGIRHTGTQEYAYRATDLTPQLLSLKRGDPEALFVFPSTGEDAGTILKTLEDVGWEVNVAGNWSMSGLAGPILQIAGPDAFKNTIGLNYTAFTYCPGDTEATPYEGFVKRAEDFAGDRFSRVSQNLSAIFYESVMVYNAAVLGSDGDISGPTIAHWIEANISSYSGMFDDLVASPTNHFLAGPGTLTAVHPDRQRPGAMFERVDCK